MAAPWIAALAAKGLSLIANAAMVYGKEWLKEKTGVDVDKGNLEPEDYLKLRQYEMEHEEELIRLRQADDRLSVEVLKLHLEDVQSARQMQQTALQQTDLFSKRFVYYFAIFWSLVASVYIAFITFGEIPARNVRFADTILGFILGTIIPTIVYYFYGTSRSSWKKDEVFAKMLGTGESQDETR